MSQKSRLLDGALDTVCTAVRAEITVEYGRPFIVGGGLSSQWTGQWRYNHFPCQPLTLEAGKAGGCTVEAIAGAVRGADGHGRGGCGFHLIRWMSALS